MTAYDLVEWALAVLLSSFLIAFSMSLLSAGTVALVIGWHVSGDYFHARRRDSRKG